MRYSPLLAVIALAFVLAAVPAKADPTAQIANTVAPVTTPVLNVVNQVPVVNALPRTVGQIQNTREGSAVGKLIALPFALAGKVISLPFSLLRHH